jgi:hypothetical protein
VTTDERSSQTPGGAPADGHGSIPQYEFRIKGHLGSRWGAWFDGLSLTVEDDGTTVIRGPVVDQAALHGVLQKLRDVGLPLVSLAQLPDAPAKSPDVPAKGPEPRYQEGN